MLSKITSWRHSKIIAFVLAVAVLLTAFYGLAPVISLAETGEQAQQSTVDIWNGSTPTFAEAFGEQTLAGKGASAETPYEITTGAQLYAAAHSHDDGADKFFEIMNDIQLQTDENLELLRQFISESETGTSTVDLTGLNEWYTTYSTDVRFKGVLNGNFHTVTGLYKSASTDQDRGVGFINDLTNKSAVKNITFDAAYVTGSRYAGVVAGTVRGGDGIHIEGCSVINSRVYNTAASNTYGFDSTGGIVGAGYNTGSVVFNNCSVYNTTLTNITGNLIGGIYGNNWSTTTGRTPPTITNCVVEGYPVALINCSGYVNTYTDTPGSIGANNNTTATELNAASMKGGAAYETMGFIPSKGWIVEDENSCPMYVGVEKAKNSDYVAPVWNGTKTLTLSDLEGDGSQETPYLISTGSELYGALQNTEEGKQFQILNDIYLGTDEISNDWNLWEKNKNFAGTLNGNGHTIYNMEEISSEGLDNSNAGVVSGGYIGAIGLIPGAQNATVNNLHMRNVKMDSIWCRYAAAIVGIAKLGTVSINGCSVDDSVISGRTGISAFVGRVTADATVNIENCVAGAGNEFFENKSLETDVCSMAGFVGINEGTVNLDDSISMGKPLVAIENAVTTPTNAYVIAAGGDYDTVADFKAALINDGATVSDAFYYDYLSDNAPMLKNRLATQDKDIDGDDDAVLDEADAVALKNILLYGGANQVNATDKTNYYNEVKGLDITDLVALYN